MKEVRNIPVGENTISVAETRNLIEMQRTLNQALTHDEYMKIMLIYKNVVDRLCNTANEMGIGI